MARNEGDARARLQQAALELFHEKGYEQTTAAEIAARAGVTERTFFRQFPDKREVLFDGQQVLSAALLDAIAAAPNALGPVETLFAAFRSVETLLADNRPFSVPRQAIIAATPALRERETAKLAALAAALAEALRGRGVGDLQAVIAAQAAMAAFAYSTVAWIEDPSVSLGARLDSAQAALKALLA
jgi:AcrR family transcriptional regulator